MWCNLLIPCTFAFITDIKLYKKIVAGHLLIYVCLSFETSQEFQTNYTNTLIHEFCLNVLMCIHV